MTKVLADDLVDIVALLNELDVFYRDAVLESATVRTAQTRSALTGNSPSAQAIIARNDAGEPLGFAAYSFLWPASGSSRSLYLKELYVAKESRRTGVGRVLLQRIFDLARDAGCRRVEWTADKSNVAAARFYEKLGAAPAPEKTVYRYQLG
ncbi:GNAT family N-acetyltransferase [Actinophytocola sediminis]